ncbi:MAG: hypothetical protein GY751_09495 [Bacteroidetes bacterium]|nr:hypothetical protein [Bacteroidota bacterium]
MGVRKINKELNMMDKSEIIKLITEMYKKIPSVKNYMDVFITGEIEQLVAKYKREIEKYIYPSGRNSELRESEARKIIRTVRKLKIIELNIELELHYVSCCLDIINDFGYWDENYYNSIEKMFYSATSGIAKLDIANKYEEQISSISNIASEYGLELLY